MGALYFGQDNDGTYGQKEIMNINGAMFLLLTNMTFSNMFAVVNVSNVSFFLDHNFNTIPLPRSLFRNKSFMFDEMT